MRPSLRFSTAYIVLFVLCALFVLPATASADFIWPALMLEPHLLTWWAIGLGLLAEWPVARLITGRTWLRSLWPNIAMNAASTLIGIVTIPLAGFVGGVVPVYGIDLFRGLMSEATFSSAVGVSVWAVTVIIAVGVNVLIEALVLKWIFHSRLSRRGIDLLALANLASVSAALLSLRMKL